MSLEILPPLITKVEGMLPFRQIDLQTVDNSNKLINRLIMMAGMPMGE